MQEWEEEEEVDDDEEECTLQLHAAGACAECAMQIHAGVLQFSAPPQLRAVLPVRDGTWNEPYLHLAQHFPPPFA